MNWNGRYRYPKTITHAFWRKIMQQPWTLSKIQGAGVSSVSPKSIAGFQQPHTKPTLKKKNPVKVKQPIGICYIKELHRCHLIYVSMRLLGEWQTTLNDLLDNSPGWLLWITPRWASGWGEMQSQLRTCSGTPSPMSFLLIPTIEYFPRLSLWAYLLTK